MRIAIDAMGGDKAPAAPIDGAILALNAYPDLSVLLVGDPAVLERELAARGGVPERLEIVASEGVVETNDEPVRAMKHKPRTQDGGGPLTDADPVAQIERLAMWDDRSDKLVQINHPDFGWMTYDRDGDR